MASGMGRSAISKCARWFSSDISGPRIWSGAMALPTGSLRAASSLRPHRPLPPRQRHRLSPLAASLPRSHSHNRSHNLPLSRGHSHKRSLQRHSRSPNRPGQQRPRAEPLYPLRHNRQQRLEGGQPNWRGGKRPSPPLRCHPVPASRHRRGPILKPLVRRSRALRCPRRKGGSRPLSLRPGQRVRVDRARLKRTHAPASILLMIRCDIGGLRSILKRDGPRAMGRCRNQHLNHRQGLRLMVQVLPVASARPAPRQVRPAAGIQARSRAPHRAAQVRPRR